MPPFSPAWNSRLPNSMNEFCPEKPCQPSPATHGGSMRPEEGWVEQVVANGAVVAVVHALGGSLLAGPPWIDLPVQSAPAQYTAPGTRRFVGTEIVSAVLAMRVPIADVPHGGQPATPADGEQRA